MEGVRSSLLSHCNDFQNWNPPGSCLSPSSTFCQRGYDRCVCSHVCKLSMCVRVCRLTRFFWVHLKNMRGFSITIFSNFLAFFLDQANAFPLLLSLATGYFITDLFLFLTCVSVLLLPGFYSCHGGKASVHSQLVNSFLKLWLRMLKSGAALSITTGKVFSLIFKVSVYIYIAKWDLKFSVTHACRPREMRFSGFIKSEINLLSAEQWLISQFIRLGKRTQVKTLTQQSSGTDTTYVHP